jgi:predicted RNA-binding Zn ribbon-like protein
MQFDAFDFSTTDPLHEHLGLDFANTTPYHYALDEDNLRTYADLLSWSINVDILSEVEAQRLLARAEQRPDEAAAVHAAAIQLREAIFRILVDVAQQRSPDSDALAHFNATLNEAMGHLQLVAQDDGFGWAWTATDTLDHMLWRVAWSTGQLLRSDEVRLVKQCGAEECDWLFLDTSRNHSRRWCDMKTCGNRAKARRYYRRSKDES